jgi:hypothetical protein
MVDKLSIPGTAKLIQGASGLVAGHSAMCLLNWIMYRIPNILIFPSDYSLEAVEKVFTFGLEFPETKHAYDGRFNINIVKEAFSDRMCQSVPGELPTVSSEDAGRKSDGVL